ncbi:lipid droplet localized protein-like [Aricia agestis]|uniref:lipid droplet localized protein-like n=1 Tax=Aricia agestis TaxID=91739 RepID=UPI001C20A93F|nr:lipid droplet localized protein-like [Aricia agestis]
MGAPHELLDLVIFGGNGYTGRLAVHQMAVVMSQHPGVRWGVAGRSRGKLEAVLREAKEKGVDTSDVAILLADVDDADSLSRLCRSCRLVVNCCGPYARYGEWVVAAAVAEGCHHVDVSAENHFTRLIESRYDAAARKAGVFVITSCGLSSVPVDVGVTYLEQNFQGTLSYVDSYLTTHPTAVSVLRGWRHGVIRYSSWESMIHGMAQKKDPEEDHTLPQKRR